METKQTKLDLGFSMISTMETLYNADMFSSKLNHFYDKVFLDNNIYEEGESGLISKNTEWKIEDFEEIVRGCLHPEIKNKIYSLHEKIG